MQALAGDLQIAATALLISALFASVYIANAGFQGSDEVAPMPTFSCASGAINS
jgi:hypothetical protein